MTCFVWCLVRKAAHAVLQPSWLRSSPGVTTCSLREQLKCSWDVTLGVFTPTALKLAYVCSATQCISSAEGLRQDADLGEGRAAETKLAEDTKDEAGTPIEGAAAEQPPETPGSPSSSEAVRAPEVTLTTSRTRATPLRGQYIAPFARRRIPYHHLCYVWVRSGNRRILLHSVCKGVVGLTTALAAAITPAHRACRLSVRGPTAGRRRLMAAASRTASLRASRPFRRATAGADRAAGTYNGSGNRFAHR